MHVDKSPSVFLNSNLLKDPRFKPRVMHRRWCVGKVVHRTEVHNKVVQYQHGAISNGCRVGSADKHDGCRWRWHPGQV